MRIEAAGVVLQTEQAIDGQSRADKEHKRQRDFSSYQQRAQPLPPSARRPTASLFQRLRDIDARALQCRKDCGKYTCNCRSPGGE
jgi:hypothetical protein